MPPPRNLLGDRPPRRGEAYGRGGAERTEIGRAVAVRVARPRVRGREPEELRDEI
jgi:hypothetical protein